MSIKVNLGAWLRWWYENGSEREYLLMLRTARAEQMTEAKKGRRGN